MPQWIAIIFRKRVEEMKKSIKTSVWIRVAIIFMVVIISGSTTILGIRGVTQFNELTNQANDILSTALTAERAHYSWLENLSSAVGLGTEFTGSADYTACSLGQWIYNTNTSDLPDTRLADLIKEIEPLHRSIHSSAAEVLALRDTNQQQAISSYISGTKSDVTKLISLLDEVVDISKSLVDRYEQDLNYAIFFTNIVTVVTIILILLVSYLLIRFVVAQVINPLQKIMVSGQKLSEGRLDYHIDVKSQNEIGQLADSLNRSGETLSLYIQDISDKLSKLAQKDLNINNDLQYIGDFTRIQSSIGLIIDQLNSTMNQIDQASFEVSHNAEQISNSAQTLAQGATEQSEEIEQLMDRLRSVSEQISSNAQDAALTSDTTAAVGEQIETCNQQMHQMAKAMEQINQSSHQIENIIKTIEDIAFQTNILSLNAAVEAARAGVAGKGFAVVAEEVRNLASRSAEATQSTADLIGQSMQSVKEGVALMENTQKSLNQVVEGSRTVLEKVKNISDSSAEQTGVINSINVSISQIAMVVQTNSATSEESAAASKELSDQAQSLQRLVNQFQLKK